MNPPPTGGHILSLPIEDPAPVMVDPPPTGPLGLAPCRSVGGGVWMAGLLRLQVSRVRDGGCARNPSPLPAACSSPYVATYPAGRAWHCWGAQQLMVLRP